MSALILDGHLKSALSCVRSLGKQRIEVVCGAERSTAMSCHSRYVQKRFVYASPKVNKKMFITEVVTEAKLLFHTHGKKPVVFCFSDATLLSLVEVYDELQEYMILSVPSRESIEIASDKKETYTLAQELSIPTITTFEEKDFESVTYPAVVKNRHSIVWNEGKSIRGSATYVFSKQELEATYAQITQETKEAPLVQAFIVGDEYGVEMMCYEGGPFVTFVHKRIRSLSPSGGAGVVKETAQETAEVSLMRMYAHALIQKLKWHGPCMVEFKIDSESGRVLLMEINGRFWGSLPLPVKAGIDFPMMLYQLEERHTVAKMPEAFLPPYVRTRHFLGDCKWLLQVLFKKDRLRSTLYPSRFRAVWDFKKEILISRGDVFMWNDLKPSIMEYVDILMKK